MIDALHWLAVASLMISSIFQHRALRRLRREVRALRRDHHDVQRWYQMLFDGLQRRPATMALPSAHEAEAA